MDLKTLKATIGQRAEKIIASGLGLQQRGIKYTCALGVDHSKQSRGIYETEWKGDHFFCYNCHKGYDIIDYLKSKHDNKWVEELYLLAGVEFKPKTFTKIKPVWRKQLDAGVKYMNSRGIEKETMDKYYVSCDDNYIYFNYVSPKPDNKLVATKWRSFPQKTFQATKGGQAILYGMHLLKKQTKLIICEGEIDALTMYQIVKEEGQDADWLCTSLPNGSTSLNKTLVENCRIWFDLFNAIIIIPDQDEAGKAFRDSAIDLLGEWTLAEVILPGKDVNECYQNPELNPSQIMNNCKKLLPTLSITKISNEEGKYIPFKTYESGYVTLDYNFAGLQEGWLTIISGRKNDGKTTFARQILLSMAMQKIKSHMFVGESTWEEERGKLARLSYGNKGGVELRLNVPAGARRYDANKKSVKEYMEKYGEYVGFTDMAQVKTETAYEQLFAELKKLVKHGYKLFVIDNLMKMTISSKGGNLFDKQRKIITDLKNFVDSNRVHIILIAHTNSGGQRISGVEEIANTADGIIRFFRMTQEGDKPTITIPEEIGKDINSYAIIEKARDDGSYMPLYFEWDPMRGALINLSTLPSAKDYEERGYWTKAIHKYDKQDLPPAIPYKD